MSERKGKRHVKRRHVEADDGWTVVSHTSASRRPDVRLLEDARPTEIAEGLTIEKLQEDLVKMQARWRDTTCARELDGILQGRQWRLKHGVCIGIGSFSLDWEHRHRSMWQLVLFLATAAIVRDDDSTMRLFAQDPAFTELDIAFLDALNINVMSAEAESCIIEASFVFAPFVDWYLLLPLFLKDRDPVLYIGNEIFDDYSTFATTPAKQVALEESNDVGASFQRGRNKVKLAAFELHGHALEGLTAYWKVPVEH